MKIVSQDKLITAKSPKRRQFSRIRPLWRAASRVTLPMYISDLSEGPLGLPEYKQHQSVKHYRDVVAKSMLSTPALTKAAILVRAQHEIAGLCPVETAPFYIVQVVAINQLHRLHTKRGSPPIRDTNTAQ